MKNKLDREKVWNAHIGGAEESAECPGCLVSKIHLTRYAGWQASHVWAHSNGGNIELYNLFPLCAVCNGKMANQNMFCRFMDMGNLGALRRLIAYVCKIVRIHYPSLWSKSSEQMHSVAKYLYFERSKGDGGIPCDHPVVKFFMQYDIQRNTRECAAAFDTYNEKMAVANKTNKLYTELYLPKRVPTLPTFLNGPPITTPLFMNRSKKPKYDNHPCALPLSDDDL